MDWRELIVSSHVRENIATKPVKGDFEHCEDIDPVFTKTRSLVLPKRHSDSQDPQQSPISSESPDLAPITSIPPIMPGWLVVYRDRDGRLCGGADDRAQGTVRICTWAGNTWIVVLANGQRLCLAAIVSVAKTDLTGRVQAAWIVRAHGYDGEGRLK